MLLKEVPELPFGDFQINWIYNKKKQNTLQVARFSPEESMRARGQIAANQFDRMLDLQTDLNDGLIN